MSFTFSRMGTRYELIEAKAAGSAQTSSRETWDQKAALDALAQQDPGLRRLRSHLSLNLHWFGLERLSPAELLSRVAQALSQGRLQLLASQPRMERAGAVPAAPEAEPEWVELAPAEPEPATETAYAVEPEHAALIAASNRSMAEQGSPFKEICHRPKCPICHGQMALMAS